MTDQPTCADCGRARTPTDLDYSPLQALLSQPCGWYSGDDGEVCGQCMDKVLGGQR